MAEIDVWMGFYRFTLYQAIRGMLYRDVPYINKPPFNNFQISRLPMLVHLTYFKDVPVIVEEPAWSYVRILEEHVLGMPHYEGVKKQDEYYRTYFLSHFPQYMEAYRNFMEGNIDA